MKYICLALGYGREVVGNYSVKVLQRCGNSIYQPWQFLHVLGIFVALNSDFCLLPCWKPLLCVCRRARVVVVAIYQMHKTKLHDIV